MKKPSTCWIFVLGMVVLAAAQPVLANFMVWSDEFDGTSIDTSTWEHMIGTGTSYGLPAGWGNNELQYYTDRPENSFVSGGALHIIAREESWGGQPYTSARLRTRYNADFQYGRLEARIQVPSTQGIWPAFWMMPTNDVYGTWAASGEIDIMESVNIATTIYGTIHYGGMWPNNTLHENHYSPGTDFSQAYHVYAVEWEPDQMRWYVDGTLYGISTSTFWYSDGAPGNPQAPFDQLFHFLLNVAVGGNFPGSPNGSSSFPQTMKVDYVRVFDLSSLQSPFLGSPHPIPGQIEAEDFDNGGPGAAYLDCDPSNNGGEYRPSEEVDIQVASEGGYNVGWMCADEYMEYTVDVASAGSYTVEARVASLATGGAFHIEFDGVDVTGSINVPATGGWQTWTTVSTSATLAAGEQVMRFINAGTSDEYNLSYFNFISTAVSCNKGDVNQDTIVDGRDIEMFVDTMIAGSAGTVEFCATDIDDDGALEVTDDASAFVTCLLGGACP